MVVYRLEHEIDNLGPFWSASTFLSDKEFEQLTESFGKFETPWVLSVSFDADYKEKLKHKLYDLGWIFGFSSQTVFDRFCPNELLEKMKSFGFDIKRYWVSNFDLFEDGQVLFERPMSNSFIQQKL